MGQADGQGRRRPSASFAKHNLFLQQEPQGDPLNEVEGAVTDEMIT